VTPLEPFDGLFDQDDYLPHEQPRVAPTNAQLVEEYNRTHYRETGAPKPTNEPHEGRA
jgi:hypothetical protein